MKRVFVLIAILGVFVGSIAAQTTAFSHQGKLDVSGTPANGNFDFEFKLFDALSGGAQQGATVQRLNVAVANGIFTVSLDFGSAALPGADRFLEIGVRASGGGGFQQLLPRQPITSTPYAVRSLSAANADNATNATNFMGTLAGDVTGTQSATVIANSAVTTAKIADANVTNAKLANLAVTDAKIADVAGSKITGTIPVASIPAGSGNYIQNSTTLQAASNFNISGTGTANIFNSSSQYNIGGSRVLSVAGSFNIFAGVGAGQANTTGVNNAFFGMSAGSANTTGYDNAFFGTGAGFSNTTGNYNAFFGSSAGFLNTTGNYNAFFGAFAGNVNTTGFDNAFFGAFAGKANTTGSRNAFFGGDAGYVNTTGFANAFFGQSAGFSNTTGNFNAFFGSSAGRLNTTGNDNAFFGRDAGFNNTIGSRNAFFGRDAGNANTTGYDNAFFGSWAGSANTTGVNNAFFGKDAGLNNTTGVNNAFFGKDAGLNNTTGSNNTMLGWDADVAFNNLTNATAIGHRAYVSTSNSMVLGSISGVNGATSNTNVGIGIQAPIARLQVRGPVLFSNDAVPADPNRAHVNIVSTSGNANLYLQGAGSTEGINFGVSGSAQNATLYIAHYDGTTYQDRLIVNQDGNVGIGTTAPSLNAKLQVNGAIRVTNGGIFVANNPNTLVITSPNGACWGITVNNSGALSTISVACP